MECEEIVDCVVGYQEEAQECREKVRKCKIV